MLVLGLLLILGSAALGVGLVYDGSEAAKVEKPVRDCRIHHSPVAGRNTARSAMPSPS